MMATKKYSHIPGVYYPGDVRPAIEPAKIGTNPVERVASVLPAGKASENPRPKARPFTGRPVGRPAGTGKTQQAKIKSGLKIPMSPTRLEAVLEILGKIKGDITEKISIHSPVFEDLKEGMRISLKIVEKWEATAKEATRWK